MDNTNRWHYLVQMNNTTHTEASAVRVTRKNITKKLGEFYIYRGWLIKKWDNNYLNDPDIRGVQWNTYKNLAAYHASRMIDIASTLRDAKMYIDNCINGGQK